jgi:hypothetical protein
MGNLPITSPPSTQSKPTHPPGGRFSSTNLGLPQFFSHLSHLPNGSLVIRGNAVRGPSMGPRMATPFRSQPKAGSVLTNTPCVRSDRRTICAPVPSKFAGASQV